MGELPEDSETRGSQDRLVVNLAGAGRKSMSLSREVCRSAGVPPGYRSSNGAGRSGRSQPRP